MNLLKSINHTALQTLFAFLAVLIAVLACIMTITTPEIRGILGLDQSPTPTMKSTPTSQLTLSPVPVNLDTNQVLSGQIARDESDAYRIQPTSTACIRLSVKGQVGFNHVLRITDNGHREIARALGGFPGKAASFSFLAESGRTYYVFVEGTDPNAAGSYSIETKVIATTC